MNGANVEVLSLVQLDVDQERQAQRCLPAMRARALLRYLVEAVFVQIREIDLLPLIVIADGTLNATPTIVEDSASSGSCLFGGYLELDSLCSVY